MQAILLEFLKTKCYFFNQSSALKHIFTPKLHQHFVLYKHISCAHLSIFSHCSLQVLCSNYNLQHHKSHLMASYILNMDPTKNVDILRSCSVQVLDFETPWLHGSLKALLKFISDSGLGMFFFPQTNRTDLKTIVLFRKKKKKSLRI